MGKKKKKEKEKKNGTKKKGSSGSGEARMSLVEPVANALGSITNVETVLLLFSHCSFSCISTCASSRYERFRPVCFFFLFPHIEVLELALTLTLSLYFRG